MGGKTGTTSQSTTIPPEVLARYNSVNATAEKAAATPFQQYGSNPSDFVAQINQQQNMGIAGINQYANSAQPILDQVQKGYSGEGYQQGVADYMNPYLQNAVGATTAQLNNINQQQQQQQRGSAIGKGSFGGDRAGIGMANLINQQNLATGATISGMENQGYQNSAQNYLSGLQNRGNFALQGQQAGLQGAQSQLGAGTLQQQTEQAGKTALYNQFLQQQAYPFQVAQFLANIAEGTGALSGSNTTTTQPMSFFGSDKRIKHDIKRVGTAHNGLPVYTFKYNGDNSEHTHIGYMAQDVEKVHPEAVAEDRQGIKYVNYEKASEPIHKYEGGLVSEGGAVGMQHMGEGFAAGGSSYDPYDPNSLQNIISRHQNMYANIDAHNVPLARDIAGGIGKHGRVPQANVPVGSLMKSGSIPQLPQDDAIARASQIASLGETGTKYYDKYKAWQAGQDKEKNSAATRQDAEKVAAPAAAEPAPKATVVGEAAPSEGLSPTQTASDEGLMDWFKSHTAARGGLIGYASGGTPQGLYSEDPKGSLDIPNENDAAKYKLMQESKLPGSMQDPTMADIQKMAAMAAMFMKAGGRSVGREHHDGSEGNVVGEKTDDIMQKYAPAIAKIESSGNYEALGPTTKAGDRAYGKYQVMGANIRPWTKEATGTEMSPEEFLANKEAQDATFKHHFGKALEKYGTPEDAASVWFSGRPRAKAGNASDITGTTVPAYLQKFTKEAGLAGGQKEASLRDPNTRTDSPVTDIGAAPMEYRVAEDQTSKAAYQPEPKVASTPAPQGLAGPKEEAPAAKTKGGLGDFFTAENVVPILTGLGAMASSKSPFLGAAALQGLGAGAESYMGTQKAQADIRQSEAATKGMEFDTQRRSFQETPWGNIMWVQGPNGTAIPKAWSDYNPRTDIPAAPPSTGTAAILERYFGPPKAGRSAPAGGLAPREQQKITEAPLVVPPEMTAPAPKGTDVGQAPTDFYDANSAKTALAERQSKGAGALEGGPSAAIPIERSKVYISNIDKMGQAARNNQQNVHEMVANLADVAAAKGWDAPGTAYTTRAQISGIANTVSRIFDGEDILENDTRSQISNKLKTLQGLIAASGAGQESVRALDELSNATANPEQNPKAFAKLSSMLMTQTQRAIDQSSHANLYGKDSGNSYIGAPADFERKNPSDRYTKEAEALSKVMINDPALFKEMMSGEMDPVTIDKMFAKGGFNGMSRYFTGGR